MSKRPGAIQAWTLEEDDQLSVAAASGESIAEISKRLCRSEKAIRHRAARLGIEFVQQRKRFGYLRRLVDSLKAKGQ